MITVIELEKFDRIVSDMILTNNQGTYIEPGDYIDIPKGYDYKNNWFEINEILEEL